MSEEDRENLKKLKEALRILKEKKKELQAELLALYHKETEYKTGRYII